MIFYGLNDMVKAGCQDCQGCSACCRGMGQSVILNPYDAFLVTKNLGVPLENLIGDKLELHVEEGVILPNMKMLGEEETCAFLDTEGRCSIHPFRPGICRLFPLGRDYSGKEIRYFLLEEGCKKENRTKVKVRKWLDTEDIKKNEDFLMSWHSFLKAVRKKMEEMKDEAFYQKADLYILKNFFFLPYEGNLDDFYSQFYNRMEKGKIDLGL